VKGRRFGDAVVHVVTPQVFFDTMAESYGSSYELKGTIAAARNALLLSELPSQGSVLELGVGTGRILSMLARAGLKCTGIDISPPMLIKARRRVPDAEFHEGDFWKRMPFAEATFDCVIAAHATLSHQPPDIDLSTFAGEILRILKPKGVFVAELLSDRFLEWLDRDPAFAAGIGDVRTGPTTSVHKNAAAGIAIVRTIQSESAWRDAFRAFRSFRSAEIGLCEWMLVAQKG
jgi:SAM-dependent methyltransferase